MRFVPRCEPAMRAIEGASTADADEKMKAFNEQRTELGEDASASLLKAGAQEANCELAEKLGQQIVATSNTIRASGTSQGVGGVSDVASALVGVPMPRMLRSWS